MNDIFRCFLTFGLFFALPYILRTILLSGVTRRRYAIIASLLLGIIFFLLWMMFVGYNSYLMGIILFVLIFLGGCLANYLMYPTIMKLIIAKKRIK